MSLAEGVILKLAMNLLLPDTQTAINVFWAELLDNVGSGPLDEDDVLDAVSNYMDEVYENIQGPMNSGVTPNLVDVWVVNEATGDLTPVGSIDVTWAPVGTDDPFPNGVAAVCELRTADTEVTGRKFVPGFDEDTATDNNLIAGDLTALLAFAEDWDAGWVDANDVELVAGVYSPTKAAFAAAIGSYGANALLGYQRRRKPGVGS